MSNRPIPAPRRKRAARRQRRQGQGRGPEAGSGTDTAVSIPRYQTMRASEGRRRNAPWTLRAVRSGVLDPGLRAVAYQPWERVCLPHVSVPSEATQDAAKRL